MKTKIECRKTSSPANTVFFGTLILTILLLGSCSSKFAFLNSSVVPAAEGSVKVKKDKNNNYRIELSVIRLAEASRLSPPKKAYIVWMESGTSGVKNIGKLGTSSGFMSKAMKSSLVTVASYEPTGFFITAEDSETVQYPGEVIVLRTTEH